MVAHCESNEASFYDASGVVSTPGQQLHTAEQHTLAVKINIFIAFPALMKIKVTKI